MTEEKERCGKRGGRENEVTKQDAITCFLAQTSD